MQGASPNGYTHADGWGVFQHPGCNTAAAGDTVELRGIEAYAVGGFDFGAFAIRIHTGSAWCETMNYETSAFAGPGCNTQTGPVWVMPDGPYSVHWAGPISPLPAGTVCGLMWFEARSQQGVALVGGGWDWRRASNPGDIRAGGVGRYNQVGTAFEPVYFSTCNRAQLEAAPLPEGP